MATTIQDVLRRLRDDGIERIVLRLCDLQGDWQTIGLDVQQLSEDAFHHGLSLQAGADDPWPAALPRSLTVSLDPGSAWIDPFLTPRSLSLIGSFQAAPDTGRPLVHCPRTLASRAMAHLAASGLADTALFSSESEYFVFQELTFHSDASGCACRAIAPHDAPEGLQSELLLTLGALGIDTRSSDRLPAPPRLALTLGPADLVRAADALMIGRYVARQGAARHGLAATFLPRPTAAPAGAGLAVHQGLFKAGQPLFFGEGTYADLSQTARWYLGGLLHHGPSLAVFTNPGTNSYRRLASGGDGPSRLTYARQDPSSVVTVPPTGRDPSQRRVVARQGDGLANPYLAFSALLLAGLDGLRRQLDPGPPADRVPPEGVAAEDCGLGVLPHDLAGSLAALAADQAYLLAGGVFSPGLLQEWIRVKGREIEALEQRPHPHEFALYPNA
ncbi:MAG: hypothetical protein ER33_01415 [Cyanobium sp. CACIAM 14]|nr:MAG: hypothetical protein ER33_01415 [Cyanobium sp. CACIAM 14]